MTTASILGKPRARLTLALAAGLVSATGFAPLGLWPVTLAAVALLVWLIGEAPSPRSAAARGWWFALGHFTLGLNWIATAFTFQDAMPHWMGWVAVVGLSIYLALFPALAAWGTWRLASLTAVEERHRDVPLLFAGLWIVTEWLRATLFTGFAWNPLAAIWVGRTPMVFLPSVGTYALSGITIGIAVVIAWLIGWMVGFFRGYPQRLKAMRADGTWLTGLLLPVIVPLGVAALILLPLWPLPNDPPVPSTGPFVRIVQPNIGQALRNAEGSDERRMQALERLTGPGSVTPRLILWPEAAVPAFLEDDLFARYRLSELLGPRDLIVTGGDALVYDAAGTLVAARNSVFAMTPDRRLLDRYDKAHLVPGGEYLPMRGALSVLGLSRLVPGDLDFMPGPGPRTMVLPGFGKMGLQLCYEMIFSGQVVDRANRPDFIFNPSNDAWFGSWGPPQHLAQARLRAAEEGLPVVRATPTGISAVIDADGRLLTALPLGEPGVIEMRLPAPHPPGSFARHGNLIPILLALAMLAAGVAPARRRA